MSDTTKDHLGHELSAEEIVRHLAVMLGWANNAVVPWTTLEREIVAMKSALAMANERAEKAEAASAAYAHAIGVEYEADGHASQPGPVDAVVRYIEEAARRSLEAVELEQQLSAREPLLAAASKYMKPGHHATCGGHPGTCSCGFYEVAAALRMTGPEVTSKIDRLREVLAELVKRVQSIDSPGVYVSTTDAQRVLAETSR